MANWKSLAIGTIAVLGLYAIGGTSLIILINQFWPSGQPVKIESFYFRVPGAEPGTWDAPPTGVKPVLTPGGRASAHVEFSKTRHCQPGARLVFINPEGEEKQFLFPEWPSLEPGAHKKNISMDVPVNLGPGDFQTQVRIYYDCQEADYLVLSPTANVKIVAGD